MLDVRLRSAPAYRDVLAAQCLVVANNLDVPIKVCLLLCAACRPGSVPYAWTVGSDVLLQSHESWVLLYFHASTLRV